MTLKKIVLPMTLRKIVLPRLSLGVTFFIILSLGATLIIIALGGCAINLPSQEMSDARQLAQAALDAGANNYFPLLMKQIADQIVTAEQQLAFANYPGARQQALIIKHEAARARSMTLILIATIETITRAQRITQLTPNIPLILQQALTAAQNGDEVLALVLAEQARQEAEQALDNYYLNHERTLNPKNNPAP